MERMGILTHIVENVERVIVDKREAIELVLLTLLCRGHVLIEDVPGVGKTSLASALARSLNCSFQRIQFTPDIMPSDITGFSIYNPKTGGFEYRAGTIFSQVILADEINRTSPKTQSSLLEAMQEKQVTVDGVTHKIPDPFIVLATQNPIEYLGTYPLPEAQMDRFMMRVSLGYPGRAEETHMVSRFRAGNPLETLSPVVSAEQIVKIQSLCEQVHVDAKICQYIVDLIRHTRDNPYTALGASPRASIALFKAAQAWALYSGRDFVIPDDVIKMSTHILSHRIVMTQESKLKKISQNDAVKDALSHVRVPV